MFIIIYVNDLPDVVIGNFLYMYADDLSVQIIRKDIAPVNGLVHSRLSIVLLSMLVVKRTYCYYV